MKTQDIDDFYRALDELAHGHAALAPDLAQRILVEFSRLSNQGPDAPSPKAEIPDELSERQVQVLTLVAGGLPYKEVGRHLGLSERTVKYHMGEIIAIFHLHNRSEAVAFARARGLTSP